MKRHYRKANKQTNNKNMKHHVIIIIIVIIFISAESIGNNVPWRIQQNKQQKETTCIHRNENKQTTPKRNEHYCDSWSNNASLCRFLSSATTRRPITHKKPPVVKGINGPTWGTFLNILSKHSFVVLKLSAGILLGLFYMRPWSNCGVVTANLEATNCNRIV